MTTLAEMLGITGDNRVNLEPLMRDHHERHELHDWFEATFAAYVVYDALCEIHGAESPRTFAAMVELFTGAFWRRAGWGTIQVIAFHDVHSDPDIREWAQDPAWVVRAASLAWTLKTAPYKDGFLGLVESDVGEGIWFNFEVKSS